MNICGYRIEIQLEKDGKWFYWGRWHEQLPEALKDHKFGIQALALVPKPQIKNLVV